VALDCFASLAMTGRVMPMRLDRCQDIKKENGLVMK
jgi:hypothetical protein